jgi:hypothetical protein
VTSIVIGSGRHRRPTMIERVFDRPLLTIVVAGVSAFITSAFITVMQKVT